MKYQMVFKYIANSFIFITILAAVAMSQGGDIQNRFESEYEAWKIIVENDMLSSRSIANEHLYKIVEIGVPVLPYLIAKMENQNSVHDFKLGLAFYLITRKIFEKEDWAIGTRGDARTKAKMFVEWWHNGIKNTPQTFNKYYEEWKKYKVESDTLKTEDMFQKIKRLGIAAIPFMIDKIRGGDLEFIKIISNHTNGSLNENALKDECLKWWDENKDKYTIIQYDQQQ